MNKESDLATRDKVEIIDKSSRRFGKTGELIAGAKVHTTMMSLGSKPVGSKEAVYWMVKLEGRKTPVRFNSNQLRRVQ
jgi:hypothetical protein